MEKTNTTTGSDASVWKRPKRRRVELTTPLLRANSQELSFLQSTVQPKVISKWPYKVDFQRGELD
jgi:hypothetical protein